MTLVAAIVDTRVPVVDAVGFFLLKLYAGGPQDLWDIEQLLAMTPDRQTLAATITERVGVLPSRCRHLWNRIVKQDD